METNTSTHGRKKNKNRKRCRLGAKLLLAIGLIFSLAGSAQAFELRVLRTGLGSGTVTSNIAGISCGSDCRHTYSIFQTVTLTVTADPGSKFVGWNGDCTGGPTTLSCNLTMEEIRSVRAEFQPTPAIPSLTDFTPEGIDAFLEAYPQVDSAARFVKALPAEFKQNWLLMTRSESLQTGTARFPRILLPNADATAVFTIGTAAYDRSYPGSHPDVIEYMQWDAAERNFRFHEIVLRWVGPMGTIEERDRAIRIDETRCSACHSTQNVVNKSLVHPGTSGVPAGRVKVKNKPNWDAYDSWGGLAPFNRDRIYEGSIEAAAFRRLLNPWTWQFDPSMRAVIEQLEPQPAGILERDTIVRFEGGPLDGTLRFPWDPEDFSGVEPPPMGTDTPADSDYLFPGTGGAATPVARGGEFVTLRHSAIPDNGAGEGRGVRFFDALGGFAGTLNQQRIADEVAGHRYATGSVPVEVRPAALATIMGCLTVDPDGDRVIPKPTVAPPEALDVAQDFFIARNGMGINDVVADTLFRAVNLPRRKADIQKINLDRSSDIYLARGASTGGLIQEFGVYTDISQGTSTDPERIRQEVFRRPIENFLEYPDRTEMGGLYIDRERYGEHTETIALARFFLEPLGVSVDKWSMNVRGRSRAYTFADIFNLGYRPVLIEIWRQSLDEDPVPGLEAPYTCTNLIAAMNDTLSEDDLPAADDPPTFTDVQRIFNRSCVECHGGLDYPPYGNHNESNLDLSEDESPPAGATRFSRSYDNAVERAADLAGPLYTSITYPYEDCPYGLMPCGGPPLSGTDIKTIERWIEGGNPSTAGDPHIRTIDGVDYDFQAAGEFVLLRGEGIELQTRQTAVPSALPLGPDAYTGLSSCVSINSAMAVRMGRHRITYQPGLDGEADPEGLVLRVDGELIPQEVTELNLPLGGRVLRSGPGGVLQVEYRGTVVVVTPVWWGHHGVWFMNIDLRRARATRGLMGLVAPGQWLPALPDGTELGSRPSSLNERYEDLYDELGNAWRVTENDSLFDYAGGTDTRSFTIEEWPLGESPDHCKIGLPALGTPVTEPQEPMDEEDAAQHCADVVDEARRLHCTMDVAVTGEPAFAEAYLQGELRSLNEPPASPHLVSPPRGPETYSQPVNLVWKPGDEKDLESRHLLCVWPQEERFNYDHCVQVKDTILTWPDVFYEQGIDFDPQSGDGYFWKVLAEDKLGAVSSSETWRFELD